MTRTHPWRAYPYAKLRPYPDASVAVVAEYRLVQPDDVVLHYAKYAGVCTENLGHVHDFVMAAVQHKSLTSTCFLAI